MVALFNCIEYQTHFLEALMKASVLTLPMVLGLSPFCVWVERELTSQNLDLTKERLVASMAGLGYRLVVRNEKKLEFNRARFHFPGTGVKVVFQNGVPHIMGPDNLVELIEKELTYKEAKDQNKVPKVA